MRKQTKNGINSRRVGAILALLSFTAYMPLPTFAMDIPTIDKNTMPDVANVIGGTISDVYTNSNGNVQMDATVDKGIGNVMQGDFNSFSVGSNGVFNTVFTDPSQTALYRVIGSDPSVIYGRMTETCAVANCGTDNSGKVILLNPNGIMFGAGSQINLNSFTASTYDIKGVKNLKDLTPSQLNSYKTQVNPDTNIASGGLVNLVGYNKTVQFVSDGSGNGVIKADGAKFFKNNKDGSGAKTYAMVSDNIDIKDTVIQTHYTSNPANAITSNASQTKSTVKLVTGDGVNFYYTSMGDVRDTGDVDKNGNPIRTSYRNADSKSASVEKNINIDNSRVYTGSLDIVNGTKGDKGSINISNNSKLYTKKMLGGNGTINGKQYGPDQLGTYGNIKIDGVGDVNINQSIVETTNDVQNGSEVGAKIENGNLVVNAGKNLNIKNSQVRTADSIKNTDVNNINSGNITLAAGNNVNIVQDGPAPSRYANDNAGIVSSGNLRINAGNKVSIDGYDEIHAYGYKSDAAVDSAARDLNRTMSISGKDVDINNTKLVRANNVLVNASDKINVKDTNLVGDSNINLLGQNTTIDNSHVQYKNIAFYNPANANKVNNVTIKNNASMNDSDSEGLTIVTNGDLTIDNTALSKRQISVDKNNKVVVGNAANQKFVYLQSKENNINIQNKANVNSNEGDIKLSAKGNVTVDNATVNGQLVADNNVPVDVENNAVTISANNLNVKNNGKVNSLNGDIKVVAKNDVTVEQSEIYATNGNLDITATNGKVSAKGSDSKEAKIVAERYPSLTRGGVVKITQGQTMDLNKDFGNSLVGGPTKLTLKSTNGSVVGTNLVNGAENIGAIKNVKTLKDTSKNARFTLSNNAEIIAKNNITLEGPADLTLTDLTTDSGDGTTISAAAKLNLDGLDIKNGPTTLNGGDGIKTPDNKVINANGNKVALNSPKGIDVNVKGVDNPNNGLEVNADISTGTYNPKTGKYDNNYSQDDLKGRDVKINAVDGKLAISKIKADKLDLITDKIIEGKANITRDWDHVKGFSDPEVNNMNNNNYYIEVRTPGAFNVDPTTTYDNTPNIDYIKNRNSETSSRDIDTPWASKSNETVLDNGYSNKLVKVEGSETYRKVDGTEHTTGVTTEPEFKGTEVVEDWKTIDLYDENGKKIGTQRVRTVKDNYEVKDQIAWTEDQYADYYYESKNPTVQTETYQERTHQVETTTIDQEHVATVKDGKPGNLVLVYSKTDVSLSDPETQTQNSNTITAGGDVSKSDNFAQKTGNSKTAYGYSDPRIESQVRIEKEPPCLDPDDPEPNVPQAQADPVYNGDDISTWVRIPRHAEGISNSAPVQNDLADTTSTVVAAAARLQLDDSDDDDDILE